RKLKINLAWAAGIMEALWHFTAEYCPRGNIGEFSDDQIAEAAYWPMERTPDELLLALIEARWFDIHPNLRYYVHDWHEHAEYTVHNRLARAKTFFANGAQPN